MKLKSFMMLAGIGLIATSMAYTAPVLADDSSNTDQNMQTPSDTQMPSSSTPSDTQMPNSSTPSANNNNTDDNGNTPDTANSDDDY